MSAVSPGAAPSRRRPGLRHYVLLVGLMDALTGLFMVASPALVLRLMWVPGSPAEPIWLRFIGAFVAGVGLVYLYPLARPRARGETLLPAVIEVTAIVRAAVGLFVAASILRGALPVAWLSVAVTDLGLAVFQGTVVVRTGRTGGER